MLVPVAIAALFAEDAFRSGGAEGDEGEGTLGAFLRNPPLALSVVEDIVDEEHRRRDSVVLCFYTWPGDGEITS